MTGKGDPAAESLRAAARELVDIATTIQDASGHATAALTDGALLRALPRAASAARLAYRALLRATTSGAGLGYALTGGRAATLAAKAGAVLGAESLAVRVLATSLRLRISAVVSGHPELAGDPMVTRLVDAAAADRDLEALRALRALVKDRGAVRALSRLAPVLGEVLALRALLDENPLNDTTAWLIATGKGYASADPITGVSNKIIAVLDVGEGAARPTELPAAESARLCARGSLLGFLGNISALGTGGRVLIQSVEGPDGVIRHVLQAPGMRVGHPDGDSPQDLFGAFSSAVLNSSPYSRALAKAVADYGVPHGAELALVGHSAGGAAIMNLAQDAEFCARHTVTHVVAVGSPVDFKQPADPRTWVASVTNQHDIVPTLDGQGAGNCFDLHPDWYVVDYADPTHLFPICHSIDRYRANLAHDLPGEREHIDARLTPYRGAVVRSQAYLLFDRPPWRPDFPFLTVPTRVAPGPDGPVDLPIRTRDGAALTAYFAVRPEAVRDLLDVTGPAVRVGGRVLVAVHAARNRDTSTADHHELHLGILVPGPPHDLAGLARPLRRTDLLGVADLVRRVDVRCSGSFLVGSAVDAAGVQSLAATLWGGETYLTGLELRVSPRSVRLAADQVFSLRGRLGAAVPLSDPGFVGYAREGDTTLRSSVRARGRARLHPAPVLRLAVEPHSSHPLAERLRDLGLDGARPLLCLTSTARQSLRDAAVPVPPA
ncbi:hypothetical protein SAMN05421874_11032 [Nonomuraea maritima]|uniref:Lipase (Class 3) n=1 Tax=Nonomuraea maritima TaxID=683260 RepID=A0A1G9DWD4_9ACTN|nr:hypothetical protein [Nonomuraea maritima]SDK68185.1 hypothetical protein SAMN05421874_11032 [Nonomuraea maritima]